MITINNILYARMKQLTRKTGAERLIDTPSGTLYNQRRNKEGSAMKFGKKRPAPHFDDTLRTPVIRCSICTGEQVAGFRRKDTGTFEEVMLIRSDEDLQAFRDTYGIEGEIKKIY